MALKLDGWEKQVELTDQWLQGQLPIPEIPRQVGGRTNCELVHYGAGNVAPGQAIPCAW